MKKKIFYISIFILFIIILFLSPISGDDWGNYIEGAKGFYHSISEAVGMYFDWEGRFISRVLINILTYHKFLWNVINSILITSIVFFIIKIINPKHKKIICLLSLLVILLMNIFTFFQVVVWVAGNITYLFVIPLLLGYFYYLFDYKKNNKFLVYLFGILNFIMPMFIEHMAVILVISNIIIFVYKYIKERCIDKKLLLYLIISIIGTLLMLLSPGTKIRSGMENVEFSKLSILSKFIYNIPNFINYTFIVNYFLLILMVCANIYLIKRHTKNKLLKYFLLIFMTIIPILNCINYFISNLDMVSFPLFNCNSVILSLYYAIYLIIMLYFIVMDTYKDRDKKIIFFFIIGILSNLVMMISPVWGYRTSFATYIFLSISMLMIIDKYIKERKLYNIILNILCIGFSLFYIILYISVNLQYKDNLKIIDNGKRKNSKVIEIVKYPHYVDINPENDFHIMRYKKYYDLDEDVEIILKENNWKYFIFYSK